MKPLKLSKIVLIALLLVALTATVPDWEMEMHSRDPQAEEKSVSDENKISGAPAPDPEHLPDWRRSASNISIRLMKSNYCQKSQVTVATALTPYFDVCLNKDGFRDKNYSRDKPGDTLRIAVLGDAVTFGLGVENNQTWPSYLEEHLERRYDERDVQTLNFGLPFIGTKEEILWMNHSGRKYGPDIVILQYMDNDAQNRSRVSQLESEYREKLSDNDSIKISKIAHRQALRRERAERKNMSVDEETRIVDRYLEKLEDYSKKDDFKVFIVYYTNEYTDRHLSYLRNKTRENNWGFIVSDLKNRSYTYSSSFYLKPRGHNKTAKQVAEGLIQQGYLKSNQ